MREAQIKRAQAQSQAQALGAAGGSSLSGGLGSLSSQFGAKTGFAGQMSGLSGRVTMASQKASMFGDIAGLGMTLFNAGSSGAFDNFGKTESKLPSNFYNQAGT
jgi:hypothetical protein